MAINTYPVIRMNWANPRDVEKNNKTVKLQRLNITSEQVVPNSRIKSKKGYKDIIIQDIFLTKVDIGGVLQSAIAKKFRSELKDYMDTSFSEPVRINRRDGESFILMSEQIYDDLRNEIQSFQRRNPVIINFA